mmetsp:Transcript_6556/g.16269  ORF Transcript_6556/g.16269 Transcript_6556/m.16269 type:complete len:238 (-) Transcript_6556:782-1495(-)
MYAHTRTSIEIHTQKYTLLCVCTSRMIVQTQRTTHTHQNMGGGIIKTCARVLPIDRYHSPLCRPHLNIIASCSALNTFSLSLFICLTVITCLVSANRLEVDPPPLLLFVGIVRARREEETSDCCLAGIIFARTVDHPRFVPSPPSDTASPPVLSCCDSSSRTLFVPSSPSPSPPPPPFASLILSTPCEVRSLATPPPPPFLLPSSSRFISTSSWPGRVGLGCFSFFPSLSLSLPLSL